ncbi:PPE family protein, partial [Mycobacterium shinjukuense]
MNFAVLPPEVNSARLYMGAGLGPMLEAAAAWDGLAVELGLAATSFGSVTSALVGAAWQGPASVAMTSVAAPYLGWLRAAAAQAEQAAAQARVAAAAFEAARAATVHPALISANRAQLVSLVRSNVLGQNAPAIAAAEAQYELMWAQDVAAMFDYHTGASAMASALTPFSQRLAGLAGQMASASAGSAVPASAAVTAASQAAVGPFHNLGLANVGAGNVGNANIGDFNFGSGNLGNSNFGFGNVGSNNIGFGNAGPLLTVGIHNIGFGNTGSGNIGFGNTGNNNIGFGNTGNGNNGIGLSGDNLWGFGGWNSGSANIGFFNSGTGNIGIGNSGTGNWGIGNSGTGNFGIGNPGNGNTGIGNTGAVNTGFFNAGTVNSGVANVGSFNTGNFNTGSFNTGSVNPGDYNTGYFNRGNYNTGLFNTGNVNTGAFNSGDFNNGFFVSGDNRNQIAVNLDVKIPTVPINAKFSIPVNMTRQFGGTTVTIPGYFYPQHYFLDGFFYFGPFDLPQSAITIPLVTLTIGGPTTNIDITIAGALEGRTIHIIDIPAAPGFGNSTSGPSSGFFNSGTG